MGEVAVLIIKFDNVFASGQLQRLWPHYMKLVRLIEQNRGRLDTTKLQELYQNQEDFTQDDVQGLENILQKLDFLFTGDMFQVEYLSN